MKQRLGVMRAAALTAVLAATQVPAHAGFIDDVGPVAKPAPVAEKSPVVPPALAAQVVAAPVAAVAPEVKAAVPALPPFMLVQGVPVGDQLKAFGKAAGWDLSWEADPYVRDHSTPIPGDFEEGLLFFLKGVNETGTRLRAMFYRGNKTVRVTEF